MGAPLAHGSGRVGVMVRPLISVEELVELLAHPIAPAVLDVRWTLMGPPAKDAYLQSHIPGAAFVDLDSALAAPPGEQGRHPLPDPVAAAAALRDAGVDIERPVVVYDAKDSSASARAWWILRWLGHEDVRVLDGGFAAWTRAELPVAEGVHFIAQGDFVGLPGAMPIMTMEEAAVVVESGTVLIDARTAERYRGESEPIDPVAGHIPGALSLPTASHVDPDGHFLPAAVLADQFERAGVTGEAPIAAYCGSGVTACHTLLALEVAGHRGALFPESWSGWITDPDRPVATA